MSWPLSCNRHSQPTQTHTYTQARTHKHACAYTFLHGFYLSASLSVDVTLSALTSVAQRWGLVALACLMGHPFANCSFEGADVSGVGAGIWEGVSVPLDQTDGGGSGSIHLALWEQQSSTSNNKDATCWPPASALAGIRRHTCWNTRMLVFKHTCAFIRTF